LVCFRFASASRFGVMHDRLDIGTEALPRNQLQQKRISLANSSFQQRKWKTCFLDVLAMFGRLTDPAAIYFC
jgi:hypothetical protein